MKKSRDEDDSLKNLLDSQSEEFSLALMTISSHKS